MWMAQLPPRNGGLPVPIFLSGSGRVVFSSSFHVTVVISMKKKDILAGCVRVVFKNSFLAVCDMRPAQSRYVNVPQQWPNPKPLPL